MNKTHRSATWGILLIASLALAGILACQAGGGEPPTVQITFPPTGRQVAVGTQVPIHSLSQDDRGISRVELWSGGELVETTTSSGTERAVVAVQHWTASEVGVFNIGVRAYDSDGQASEPVIITVQVVATAGEVAEPLPEEPEPPTQPPPEAPPPPPEEPTATPLPVAEAPTPQTTTIAPSGPDLETGNCGYPPPARVGEPVAFGLIIWNSGDDYARDFRWGIKPTTSATDFMPSGEYIVLGPNEDRWFDWQGPPIVYDEPGQYTAVMMVDVEGSVGEQSEDNNQCQVQVTVEDGVAAAEELVLHALTQQSGYLSVGMGGTHVAHDGVVRVGDDAGNGQLKGFLFFDISWIPDGATVESATLNLSSRQREGNPPADLGTLRVYYGNYGDLDGGDWDAESFRVVGLESGAEIGSNVDVTDSVATARANVWYYQLRLQFVEPTDGDGSEDSLEFNTGEGGVVLTVTYTQ
jgi:hypothetical protein